MLNLIPMRNCCKKYKATSTIEMKGNDKINIAFKKPRIRESMGDSLFDENGLEQTFEDNAFEELQNINQFDKESRSNHNDRSKIPEEWERQCLTPNTEDNFYSKPGKIVNKDLIDFSRRLRTKVNSVLVNSVNSSVNETMRSKLLIENARNFQPSIALKKNLQEMYDFVKIEKKWLETNKKLVCLQ